MGNYFQTNLDLTYKYKLTPTPEEQASQSSDLLAAFKQGKIAMMITYTLSWNRAFGMLKDMEVAGYPLWKALSIDRLRFWYERDTIANFNLQIRYFLQDYNVPSK